MNTENPDTQLAVEFFMKPVENLAKSREAGRPIFEDREYVRIAFPGDQRRKLEAPASEMHYVSHARTQMTYAERFAGTYDAFKRNDMAFVEGTPLKASGLLPLAKCEELKALNVLTVEQLAGMPDVAMRKLGMGGRQMVDDAKAYLEKASKMADTSALEARIKELEALLSKPAAQAAPVDDQFAGFEDEDLKNMIRDAGGEVPRGRASRQTLIDTINELAKAKEDA